MAADLLLEERLQRLSDMNLAFAGGDVARNHADALRDKRREIGEALHPTPVEERRETTLEQIARARAMFGGGV